LKHFKNKNMTQDEVAKALQSLSAEFHIATPTLRWRDGIQMAWTTKEGDRITMGRMRNPVTGQLMSTRDIMLHEFAHALASQRFGRDTEMHGHEFQLCLVEVVKASLDAPGDYSWSTEMQYIRAFAERVGVFRLKNRTTKRSVKRRADVR